MVPLRVFLPSLACLSATIATAQGPTNYLNFEAPVVKPITVALIGTTNYLLACNTPDNAVEVYSLANPDAPAFAARIPVGLEPVSLAFKTFQDGTNMLYTANWLGDSVTYVQLFSPSFSYQLKGTFNIARSRITGDDGDVGTSSDLNDAPIDGDEPVFVYPVEVKVQDPS